MTATVEIKSPDVARKFCRAVAARGVLTGSACWVDEKWMKLAGAYLRNMPADRAAGLLKMIKAKPRSFRIFGAVCTRCGCSISAPESVALGLGPECQAK